MKTLLKILVLLVSLLPLSIAIANEDIIGIWQGELVVDSETEITLRFTISQDSDGTYTAILNSPDQGAIKNVNANSVTYSSNVLKMDVAELSGSYEGTVKDRLIEGTWKQEGTSFPLNLTPYRKRIFTQEDIDAAIAAANAFVELTDTGQYSDAYEFMMENKKRNDTVEQFIGGIEMIREHLGKPKSRNILSSEYTDKMMGEKAGDYVEIVFETTFEKQEEPMLERIIMTEENGEWKVGDLSFTSEVMHQKKQTQEDGMMEEGGPGDIMAAFSSAEEVPMDQKEIDAALAAAQQYFENNQLQSSHMGEIESREMTSAKGVHIENMPSMPDGDYIQLEFETRFKGNENAQLETVLLGNANGNWMVMLKFSGSPIGRGRAEGGAEFRRRTLEKRYDH